MTHGSLFSGIGGFDLAAQWMGWTNVFHCEMNPFGQRVLAHYFPESKLHEDVTTFPASDYAGRIDILTGGFPCQPYSMAGKRMGKDDDRHLWPAMLDVIRIIQPTWVVGENVRGLVSWNGGMVFEEVCADLETCGYSVQPFILPACSVNAPHRRDRVWFVAHANDGRLSFTKTTKRKQRESKFNNGSEIRDSFSTISGKRDAAHANSKLCECRHGERTTERTTEQVNRIEPFDESTGWAKFPTQPAICGGDDGLPAELDGITFSKWRNESIKAYGNAIVPQVAYQIFQAINEYERT